MSSVCVRARLHMYACVRVCVRVSESAKNAVLQLDAENADADYIGL